MEAFVNTGRAAFGYPLQRNPRRLAAHIKNDAAGVHQKIDLGWRLYGQLLECSAVALQVGTQLGYRSRRSGRRNVSGCNGLDGGGLVRLDRLACHAGRLTEHHQHNNAVALIREGSVTQSTRWARQSTTRAAKRRNASTPRVPQGL